MRTIKETCVAGSTIDITYKQPRANYKKGGRKPKLNSTPKAVIANNNRIAIKSLSRILNNNFAQGDNHDVLTYDVQPGSNEEAKKNLQKFQRKYRSECKKLGINGKYVTVTEYQNSNRIHHHAVLTHLPDEVIKKIWPHGHVIHKEIYSKNLSELAKYLIKETSKTYAEEGSGFRRRYSSSRNVVKPEIKKEVVSDREMRKDIKPYKGYYIDQDSIVRFENKFTGLEHLEYTMISTDSSRKRKKWYKGNTVICPERKLQFHGEKQLVITGSQEDRSCQTSERE